MSTTATTPTDATVLVRYVRNADETASTEAIKFHDDSRPDLPIGRLGYVTKQEFYVAAATGVIFEAVEAGTEEEYAQRYNLVLPPVPGSEEDPATEAKPWHEGLKNDDLRKVAEAEEVDISGLRSNADIISAVDASRQVGQEGLASLPATALVDAGTPSTDTASAGSGNAIPSGTASAGGVTAS